MASVIGHTATQYLVFSGITRYGVPTDSSEYLLPPPSIDYVTYHAGGTFSNLSLVMITNTYASGTFLAQLQINGINGNESVSVPAGSSGQFSDAVDFDSIGDGAQVVIQYINTFSSGSAELGQTVLTFSSSINTIKRLCCMANGGPTNPQTYYYCFAGGFAPSFFPTTITNCQLESFSNGQLKNLFIAVAGNSVDTALTIGSIINGSTGNLLISIPVVTVGIYEDLINSDALSSSGTKFEGYIVSTGAGDCLICTFGADLYSTDNTFLVGNGTEAGKAVNTTNGNLFPTFGGSTDAGGATDAAAQCQQLVPFTLSKLVVGICQNSVTTSCSLVFRKNATNGNLGVSIPANTTGFFLDSLDIDNVLATDNVNYMFTVGATGSLTPMTISATASTPYLPQFPGPFSGPGVEQEYQWLGGDEF